MHCTRVIGCHVVAIVAPRVAAAGCGGSYETTQCRRQAKRWCARSLQFCWKTPKPTRQEQQFIDLVRRDLRRLALDGRKNLLEERRQSCLIVGGLRHVHLRAYTSATYEIH